MIDSRVAMVASAGQVEFQAKKLPPPGASQLLLKALCSSISAGTEHMLMAGKILPLPQTLGYSMVAEVIDTGRDVEHFRPGDRVCVTAEHADYLLVDQRLATPVPADVSAEQAAFFNLAHTALYGIRQADLRLGEPCLIMGQGLLGALAAQFALAAGALPVVVTDVLDARLQLAQSMGISRAINPVTEPEAVRRCLDELEIDGFPVIVEATGSREPLIQALELIGERGRIAMLSLGNEALPAEALQALMVKGARLLGGYVNSKPFQLYRTDIEITDQWPPSIAAGQRRFADSSCWTSDADIRVFLRLLQSGRLDISPLISHRFGSDEIPRAYELVWQKSPELLGGLICWDS